MNIRKYARKSRFLVISALISIVGASGILIHSTISARDQTSASNSSGANANIGDKVSTESIGSSGSEQTVAEPLPPIPEPNPETLSAQHALPAQTDNGYDSACASVKSDYTNDYTNMITAEDNRYEATRQQIMNKYGNEGMSFSKLQKNAQKQEAGRHDSIVDQLTDWYKKQLKALSC